MSIEPLLFFAMQLDSTPQLNIGRLFLIDTRNEGFLGRWLATSGLGDYQDMSEWNKQGGGCIPPNYQTTNTKFYWVHTKPIWQDLNGLKTNTYAIDPLFVKTTEGIERSELLIHASRYANPQSGSLGCIVLPNNEFNDFEDKFKIYCSHLERVKLLVGYTF